MAQFALNVKIDDSYKPCIDKLNEYLNEGWKVAMISSPTTSYGGGSTRYMTYILEKADEKKVE